MSLTDRLHAVDALNSEFSKLPRKRRKEPARAEVLRGYLIKLDADYDRAVGRAIRWTNIVADLRKKRKATARRLAQVLAGG